MAPAAERPSTSGDLRSLVADGGLRMTVKLSGRCGRTDCRMVACERDRCGGAGPAERPTFRKARALVLLAQIDGDMVLAVPDDFGRVAEDEALAGALFAEARRRLTAVWTEGVVGRWRPVLYTIGAAAALGPPAAAWLTAAEPQALLLGLAADVIVVPAALLLGKGLIRWAAARALRSRVDTRGAGR